jgi:hypothetical protein
MPARQFDPVTASDLANLMADLSHNPKTRAKVAKLVKEISPDSPHAQAFRDVDVEDRFEKFQADQEAKELERQQKQVLDRMNRQRAKLLTGGDDGAGPKYTEDDVKKIETLMQEKGITDYDDGRIIYAAKNPPLDREPSDPPPSVKSSTWEMPEFAKYAENPKQASYDTAYSMIGDFMRKR